MVGKLTKLRKSLSIEEACEYLVEKLGESVTITDIMRLVLEKHIELSIYLHSHHSVIRGEHVDKREEDGAFYPNNFDDTIRFERKVSLELGQFRLGMYGAEVDRLGERYSAASGSNVLHGLVFNGAGGISFKRGDQHFILLEDYESNSKLEGSVSNLAEMEDLLYDGNDQAFENLKVKYAEIRDQFFKQNFVIKDGGWIEVMAIDFPADSELIFELSELDRFIESVNAESKPNKSNVDTLSQREKNSLLIVIAAMCKQADFDYSQRGISKAIEAVTEEMGVRVSDDTIRKILKQIPDALESRRK